MRLFRMLTLGMHMFRNEVVDNSPTILRTRAWSSLESL